MIRDQSEDRGPMPRAIAIAVDNPSGVKPGLYWAVFDRTTMTRVSVWFKSPWEASKQADTWEEQYPYPGEAWKPVNHNAVNMVWEQPSTHRDGYAYAEGE